MGRSGPWLSCRWRQSTGAGMAACMTGLTAAGSKCGGCGPLGPRPLPRAADGPLVLAVDVSPWLRPDAPTSAERLFCHVYGRGRGSAQMIPGWPCSFVAALETGRSPGPRYWM